MEENPPSGGPPDDSPRRSRLRLFAAVALVFLLSVALMIVCLPHDSAKDRLVPLVLADVAFASVVCMILVFILRKR